VPDRGATLRLVLSCEHARNRVPRRWAGLFRGRERVLASHRGYDIGALELARYLGRRLGVPLHAAPATRLLIDPNRSLGHPRLFSDRSRRLPIHEREALRDQLYHPHRSAVEHAVATLVAGGARVLHLGVHSFTPRLGGETRRADVGLLYDPGRALEQEIAGVLAGRLTEGPLRIRRNYPYRGTADGFTTYLRTRFRPSRYAGLELEVNQRLAVGPAGPRRRLQRFLASSLAEILAPPP
jgi:predicted N-formylglutamate amidohydrolase